MMRARPGNPFDGTAGALANVTCVPTAILCHSGWRRAHLRSQSRITMPGPHVLNPQPLELKRFLHSPVGEDRNGSVGRCLCGACS